MNFGYREVCLDHDTGERHPESPDRLRAVRRALTDSHGVEYFDAPDPDMDLVRAVHDEHYIEEFREYCADGGGHWDADTVAVEATWDAALASAGVAVWAAEQAAPGVRGRETPFALGRPPGHHAVYDDAMGFCFINNAGVAAQAALEDDADRVAIFDWDVHHGNGTQDIFYDRGDVFYASIHEESLYPGTGAVEETGEGDGEGTTLNLPLPAGAGDADYTAAVDKLVAPAIEAFDPELFLVSAGFDAHRHDPISRFHVSTEGYAMLADRVRAVSDATDAPLAFVLEGGYGLDTLAEGVGVVHETFDGRDPVELDDDEDDVSTSVQYVLDELRDTHQAFGSK
jgi:acetoin utilization deacetylase AcuC-like enzyme